MLHRFKKDEGGFTLIELLVVILIIGILAAIALPTFLGQREKAQDSSAKSNARNAVTMVESCYADTQNYTSCDTAAALNPSGLTIVDDAPNAEGEVQVVSTDQDSFGVVAFSLASDKTFHIYKNNGGAPVRTCSEAGGGCNASWGAVAAAPAGDGTDGA